MNSYLAIDIGAGSGRHILGELVDGSLVLKEIYRFENGFLEKNGSLCWDLSLLFEHILLGIKECIKHHTIPTSIGIDTWGVDFVLLDKDYKILGDTVAYRDSRTDGMDLEVEKTISFPDLYIRTGIQKMLLNSIYQLMAIKLKNKDLLDNTAHFLLIPDYLNYLLTGKTHTEYTNASTTSLVDVIKRDWDYQLIDLLGFPRHIFGSISIPGISIGSLSGNIAENVEANLDVTLIATHDTASAFISIPSEKDSSVFISSGTWSLLGVETTEAIVSKASEEANFTNEGGYNNTYRYLKNIMGLWMLQSVRRDLGMKYSYLELANLARNGSEYDEIVDVNNSIFIAPDNMLDALNDMLKQEDRPLPRTLEESLYCIYHSLAVSYRDNIKNLETITNKRYTQINIVGGGCQDEYLNQLTADITGLKVVAGPIEATAIGNLLVQMITSNEISNLSEARKIVRNSFDVKEYLPFR